MISRIKHRIPFILLAVIAILWAMANSPTPAQAAVTEWAIAGRVLDPQESPVPGAEVSLFLNEGSEEPLVSTESQENGTYVLPLSEENLDFAEVYIEIERPHFENDTQQLTPAQLGLLEEGQSVTIGDIIQIVENAMVALD